MLNLRSLLMTSAALFAFSMPLASTASAQQMDTLEIPDDGHKDYGQAQTNQRVKVFNVGQGKIKFRRFDLWTGKWRITTIKPGEVKSFDVSKFEYFQIIDVPDRQNARVGVQIVKR